jgi:hypothetical protein
LQVKTKIVSSHTADSKRVKQEVNGKVILPPLVFPASSHTRFEYDVTNFAGLKEPKKDFFKLGLD